MGVPSKRVQASLSSFFKRKEPAAKKQREEEAPPVTTPRPAKRPRVTRAAAKPSAAPDSDGGSKEEHANEEGEEEGDEEEAASLVASTATHLSQLSMRGPLSSTHVQLVRRQAGAKYTALEEQVLDLKQQHRSSVLMVEVGYKYRFFGEDARIASQVLSIMCTQGGNSFYSASVPTPRLRVHLRRLVHAGYRVAVVRQQETAALKAAGSNRSAPFTRAVGEIVTPATLVEEEDEGDAPWLLSVAELGGTLGLAAVQPATGAVLVDDFAATHDALATRLAHLRPRELLLPRTLGAEAHRVLALYAGRTLDAAESPEPLLEHAGRTHVTFTDEPAPAVDRCAGLDALGMAPHIADLAPAAERALARVLAYLAPLGMARMVLAHGGAFARFHTRTHMLLSATALEALQVFGEDSLFATVDCTRTAFGRRMLRRWVAHPLVDAEALAARHDAVAYLRAGLLGEHAEDSGLAAAHVRMRSLGDVERGLSRVYYAMAAPAELARVLRSLAQAAELLPAAAPKAAPALVGRVLRQAHQPELRQLLAGWLASIDAKAARAGHKARMFTAGPLSELLATHHRRVQEAEQALQDEAPRAARALGLRDFAFRSISGIDCLVDVRATQTVPADWVRVSSTKTHRRYHTPATVRLLAEREQCREALQLAAAQAYTDFLAQISAHHVALRQLVAALATFDALTALATLAASPGYCRPQMADEEAAHVRLVGAEHPVLRRHTAAYVPNDVDLRAGQAVLLTGPNAGGKSSLIRTVAVLCVLAQSGSYVSAQSAHLGILDAVHTRMGAHDDLMRGRSTFMVEMLETAAILQQSTSRSLAIIDELGRGTSTHDGAAIAYAVLAQLVASRVPTLFVTHYAHIVDAFAANDSVKPCHMAYVEEKTADGIAELTFLYALREGASRDSFGLNVARIAGLPHALLLRARERAEWMRVDIESKRAAKHARDLQLAVRAALNG
ncbi:Mismatch repair protein msh3 [Coemansia erecta]|uniref:DNA mismatch repair protein MSH3 n=1 Tax=Coemansia erecta TaxID=147472 RepID=A0A9W7Y448_9FUNG|nr:Mismatch repair protein msh3 [Coemansia erecta]